MEAGAAAARPSGRLQKHLPARLRLPLPRRPRRPRASKGWTQRPAAANQEAEADSGHASLCGIPPPAPETPPSGLAWERPWGSMGGSSSKVRITPRGMVHIVTAMRSTGRVNNSLLVLKCIYSLNHSSSTHPPVHQSDCLSTQPKLWALPVCQVLSRVLVINSDDPVLVSGSSESGEDVRQ